MPLRCADCNHKMLLTPDGATASVACENCGGQRLERDQPSPTRSDFEVRDAVDPGIGLDQGGNPNQEGIWATVDGGWQPWIRRDESYASVRTAMDFDFNNIDFESEPRVPSHHVVVDKYGGVFSGAYPETHEEIQERHGIDASNYHGLSKGAVFPEGDTEWYTHESGHTPAVMEQMLHGHFGTPVKVDPNLAGQTEDQRWGIEPGASGNGRSELDILNGSPHRRRERGTPLDRNEGLVRGGSLEAHFPFYADDQLAEAPVAGPPQPQYHAEAIPGSHPNALRNTTDGSNLGIHAGTTKWLGYLDAHIDGKRVRDDSQAIVRQYANSDKPVTVSVHHPDHLPAAVDLIEHSSDGSRPSPIMIEVGRGIQRGQIEPPPGIKPRQAATHIAKTYGIPHLAFLPALLGLGAGAARMIAPTVLTKAVPFLMRGALQGQGSNMAPQPNVGPRDVSQLAHVTADLVTPHTNPGYHDSPDGDTKQFKDQSSDPNPDNPNLNGEAGGSQLGEDNVPGGFGPNSPSMEKFNLLFPAILHYFHAPESAANDPMIKQLHEMMDQEVPGYLDSVNDDEGHEAVQHLIEHLRKPEHVHAMLKEAQVPMMPGQMMPMMPGQALPAPDQATPHPETVGNCMYCGGTTLADGTCPQCGAKAGPYGAQPMAGPAQPAIGPAPPNGGNPMTTTPFVGSRQAADTPGPVSKEQQAAVAQLLIDTKRHEEIPVMLQQPEHYVDELAQVMQDNQTKPPVVDPNEQPAPPPPPMDPSQMGQMPMPGMSAPAPGPPAGGSPFMGKVATPNSGAPRCPQCGSATTGFVSSEIGEVSGDCHSCGNVWDIPDASGAKTAAPAYENPAAVPAPEQEHAYDPEADQDSSHSWTDADGDPIVPGQEYELFTAQYPIPDRIRVDHVKPDELVYSTIGEFDPNPNDDSGTLEYSNRISLEEFQLQKYTFQKADDQNSDAGEQHLDEYAESSQAPQFTEPVPQPNISPRGSWTPRMSFNRGQRVEVADRGPGTVVSEFQSEWPRVEVKLDSGEVVNVRTKYVTKASSVQKFAPMSEYDKYFGGKAGAAEKAKAAMIDQYGVEKGEEIFYATVNKKKKSSDETTHTSHAPVTGECPKCTSKHITSSMSSPTSQFHECYRCAHSWETQEEEYEADGAQKRAWLMSSSGPAEDDFWQGYERARKMQESGDSGSRSLAAAAARDPRTREIAERLEANKMAREAGRKFTPYEQRQLIDEQGVARNADMLDLSNTHYEAHRYLGEKANGANVPDEELFLGI